MVNTEGGKRPPISGQEVQVPPTIHPDDREAWTTAIRENQELDQRRAEERGNQLASSTEQSIQIPSLKDPSGIRTIQGENTGNLTQSAGVLARKESRRSFISKLGVGIASFMGGSGAGLWASGMEINNSPTNTPTPEASTLPAPVEKPVETAGIEAQALSPMPDVSLGLDPERPWSRKISHDNLKDLQSWLIQNRDESTHTLSARYLDAKVRPELSFTITKDSITPPEGIKSESFPEGEGYRYEVVDIDTDVLWDHSVKKDTTVDVIDSEPIRIQHGARYPEGSSESGEIIIVSEKQLDEKTAKDLQELTKLFNVYKANIKTVAVSATDTFTWSITFDQESDIGAPKRGLVTSWSEFNKSEQNGLLAAARQGAKVVLENLKNRGTEYPQQSLEMVRRLQEFHTDLIKSVQTASSDPLVNSGTPLEEGLTGYDQSQSVPEIIFPTALKAFAVDREGQFVTSATDEDAIDPIQNVDELFSNAVARLAYDFDGYEAMITSWQNNPSAQKRTDAISGMVIGILESINKDPHSLTTLFSHIPSERLGDLKKTASEYSK